MIDISQQPLTRNESRFFSFLAVFVLLDCNLESRPTKPPSSHHPNQCCPGKRTIIPALLKVWFVFFFCIWGGGGGRVGGKCGGVGKGCKLKIKRAILKVCVFWCSIRYMRMQVYKSKPVGINFPGLQFLVILVSHDYSTSTMVQEAYCSVSTFTAYFFFVTVQFYFSYSSFTFFYTSQIFFALQFSQLSFFFYVCFYDRSRRRTKESKLYQGPEWGRCEVLFFHIVY